MAATSGSVFAGRPRTGSSKLQPQQDADGNEAEFDVREDEEQNVKLGQTIDLLLAAGYFRARIKGLSPFDKWLVKRAIETREEMGDFIRSFSVSQFNKFHKTPEDIAFDEVKDKALKTVGDVKETYKPQRRYKRHDTDKLKDEESKVHSTLLEYGRRYGVSKSDKEEQEGDKSTKKKAVAAGLANQQPELTPEELQEQEEKRIQMLMSGMSAMGAQEIHLGVFSRKQQYMANQVNRGKLTASSVGSIVGMQSAQIQKIASEYAEKQAEIEQIEKTERVGGAQQHKRVTAALKKQIEQQKSKLDEAQQRSQRIDEEMEKLNQIETEENQSILQTLRSLVAMNENLKKQEQDFKAHCKEEMTRLKAQIEDLKNQTDEEDSGDKERASIIDKQYAADKEKLHKIRLLLARKTREIAVLQRKIDEVNLLNSIHDNFTQAMSSPANKEQFLKQFEQIVEGVEKRKQEEKMKRDRFNDEHLDLIEKQRLYFKTVKDFKEECRKNEILLSKLGR
ncbi:hypothetical protein KUTeg_008312 [Tegillarca granosa]|uniref:Coiled-coil domain-containing protein 93 n=1 Tax=Tegillarca granosa TaxID=220873 RepID=A0ABQ9FC06_TEGGR|nr:hypothetical protein KUTeg_008312 [Tegillarca granosa]